MSEPDPEIVIGQLENGLRYLIRDNDNPGGRVEMRLAVDAGSVLEDDTQDGGAHFLEHMLFNGTEEFPENELIAVLRSFGAGFGADINAYTDYDETVYQLTMPTDDPAVVDTGLDVLEQWLSAATIDQAQVEAERGVVLDEWRGSEASSNGRIFDAMEELFLAGSPYEDKDPIGTDTAITTTDAEPLRAFYDDWYRPDNAAVVVVGDIDTGDDRGRHRRTLRPRSGPWRLADPSGTDRPAGDRAAGVDPRRPRRGRRLRPGDAATRCRRGRVGRGRVPELDARLDGVRHHRDATRQRCTARRGAVR